MVLADSGEDEIVSCLECSYAANLEKAEILQEGEQQAEPQAPLPTEDVETPDQKTIEALSAFLSVPAGRLIKTLIYTTGEKVVAALVRGDHEVNEAKLKTALKADQVELADPALVEQVTKAPKGFAGPIGLTIPIVADRALQGMRNLVAGGNRKDVHTKNVNLDRDCSVEQYADLRLITPDDTCPRCRGALKFSRGIEVGHVFKLGIKYSQAMGANYLDETGKERPIIMGCYGIGVGRTVAAAIEQNHDENGIVFPIPIAPFEVCVLPLQMNDAGVVEAAEKIYGHLLEQGVEVLLDDRDLRAGAKFKDADLLGTPIRITIGSRSLEKGQVEMKFRKEKESALIPLAETEKRIQESIRALYDSLK